MSPPKDFVALSKLVDLSGKTAIVTGGAVGIGFAICFRLAEAGAFVVIADANGEKAGEASQRLAHRGFLVDWQRFDVSSEEEVKSLVDSVTRDKGGIDILVNNAGIYPRIPLAETSVADFDRVLAVNLRGTFLCSREVSQKMVEQRRFGSIINIASIEAIRPASEGLAAYDASKGAVVALSRSLALELGKHDIRVNTIAPGGVMTEGVRATLGTQPAVGKAMLKAFMARALLGRMGDPDDIARVALFLASDLASYMTGSLVVVDGGHLVK